MGRLRAFNIQKWIAKNRHLLKPPVGNKLIYDGDFKVMLIAGPNARTDYHVEEHEEFFYQLEGTMVLKVVDEGEFYDVPIEAGESFCLPPRVPHSPQRHAGSLGMVVERERQEGEVDTMRWYCQKKDCREILYEKRFFCRDLVADLPPIIRDYYADVENRTCGKCGFVEIPPR